MGSKIKCTVLLNITILNFMMSERAIESQQFSLNPEQFAALFPFHLVIDREMKIIQAGVVLQRIFEPIIIIGTALATHFQIKRPNCAINFVAITELSQ